MIILRPIHTTDEAQFIALSKLANIGLTSLPKDESRLQKKLQTSLDSFYKSVSLPGDEQYVFVLENCITHEIIGISAIMAATGGGEPLYFYKKEILITQSSIDQVTKKIPILSPLSYVRGPSEVCSLFLHPDFRHAGLGKLLSLGRFLFIARFPERFTASMFAELRGVIIDDESPFWNGVGRHFLDMSIVDVFEMIKYGKSFISHFLPKYPIYIPLLPQAVQEVIGRTHEQTKAALRMLLNEGFHITEEIDIFDAGPTLRVRKNDIRTIKESKRYQITKIVSEAATEKKYMMGNERIDFRALISTAIIHDDETLSLPYETSIALEVGLGDWIRLMELV